MFKPTESKYEGIGFADLRFYQTLKKAKFYIDEIAMRVMTTPTENVYVAIPSGK